MYIFLSMYMIVIMYIYIYIINRNITYVFLQHDDFAIYISWPAKSAAQASLWGGRGSG